MLVFRVLRRLILLTLWFLVMLPTSVIFSLVLYASALLRACLPWRPFQELMRQIGLGCDWCWSWVVIQLLLHVNRVHFKVQGLEHFKRGGRYLVVLNHQGAVDAFICFYLRIKGLPPLKIFAKWQVIFIPFMNFVAYALDYPLMSRYSYEVLQKKPHLRWVDLKKTERSCARIRQHPYALINFCEGTRWTEEKHKKQRSPYQHLLKPKAGGMATAIQALGNDLEQIITVSIAFPQGIPTFTQCLVGDWREVLIHIEPLPLPEALRDGHYADNPEYRTRFKEWLAQHWAEKDAWMHHHVAQKYWRYDEPQK